MKGDLVARLHKLAELHRLQDGELSDIGQLVLDAAEGLQRARAQVPDTATIRNAVARGWCAPRNTMKEMDSVLAEAITAEVAALIAVRPQT